MSDRLLAFYAKAYRHHIHGGRWVGERPWYWAIRWAGEPAGSPL